MLYSKSAEYGIQAMIYLSENRTDNPTIVSKIAESYNIPYQFLTKIVQTLVKHRLIIAKRVDVNPLWEVNRRAPLQTRELAKIIPSYFLWFLY